MKKKLKKEIKEIVDDVLRDKFMVCHFCQRVCSKNSMVKHVTEESNILSSSITFFYCSECTQKFVTKHGYEIVRYPGCQNNYLVKKETKK